MENSVSIAPYPENLNINDMKAGTSPKRTCEYGNVSSSGVEASGSSVHHVEANGGYSHQASPAVQALHNLQSPEQISYNDTEDISVSEPLSEGSIVLSGSQWDMNNEFEEDIEERSISESVSISDNLQEQLQRQQWENRNKKDFGNHDLDKSSCNQERNIPSSFEPLGEPDLVIEVTGGQRIRAHKSVLAEKSDYFRARSSRDILKIKGVSYKTLQLLVDYIYSMKLEVKQDNVVEVISGAKFLQIPCAVQCAMDSMRAQITLKNCYQVLYIAKKQRLNELKEAAYKFMSDNFLQVLRDPAVYGRLTGAERDLILQRRMDGKQYLVVAEINDAFERLSSSSRPPSRESSRPQSPSSVVSLEDDATTYQVQCYNESTGRWRSLTKLPEEVNTKGCGICVLYNYLFLAGGIKGSGQKAKLSDQVFCYNPLTDSWEKIRPLTQPRSQLKLLALDGYLYAIGGECLFTVEKYDPRLDRWSPVAPLPKGAFAVAHEATTCNGEIYVSGGTLFYRLLKYDPKRNEWQECPYNNSRRRSAGMVSHKGCIYRFDVSREHGLSVFTYNSMARHWSEGVNLRPGPGPPTPSLPFRCTVIGSNIFCINRAITIKLPLPPEGSGGEMWNCEPELSHSPEEAKGVLYPFVLYLAESKSVH
ncbi:PREDICTED: kelch repeat and BTB domain-containing protein 11 [Nanorana parkeri]|uniref:kelch repeat and BTB domain-containing protein 11 n=1 Tax=Nanorana parkeri TaxID=125878 RepID=UPI000854C516|nr:PREDICTED: kelch repeat and BTB domain-containing protein 11 [Nanorana parkeri]